MTVPLMHGVDAGAHDARRWSAYRCFLRFDAGLGGMDAIVEQLGCWLREKNIDHDLAESGFASSGESELVVVRHEVDHGPALRARLREPSPTGVWHTELLAHAPARERGWFRLVVSNSEGRTANRPRLAGYVIERLPVYDGQTPLSAEPTVIDVPQLDELIDILCDPERRAPVLAAGSTGDQDFEEFRRRVRSWTRECTGLAQSYVLTPPAHARLADEFGPRHAPVAGALRTYQPGVDPADPADARRHQVLGHSRLREPEAVVRGLLGRIMRDHAGRRKLPSVVATVDRTLSRIEDRLLLAALEGPPSQRTAGPGEVGGTPPERRVDPVPSVSELEIADEASTYLTQIERLRAALGVPDLSEESLDYVGGLIRRSRTDSGALDRLTREMSKRQELIGELEDERNYYRELAAEEELEHGVTEERAATLEDENRWLRGRLRELRDYAAANGAVPDTAVTRYPSDFAELLDWARGLQSDGVVFTGAPGRARDLDDIDGLGRFVRASWDVLLVLTDYVRSRHRGDHDRGIEEYLRHPPQGYRPYSVKRHAAGETSATMNAYGRERIFPVPAVVDPSGSHVMEAHFKIGHHGMKSPRLYYLDDWARSETVYVGYIGVHLTNMQTN